MKQFAELLALIAREFGRIPHYNDEGERLLRAMRNHRETRTDPARVRIVRRVLDRGKERAVALSL